MSPVPARRFDRLPRAGATLSGAVARRSPVWRAVLGVLALSALLAGGAFAASWRGVDLRSVFGIRSVLALTGEFASPETPAPTAVAREVTLVLPRRGEMILINARSLMAGGHFREALTALDTVRPTDPQRGDADRLRAEIQQQLIALATLPAVPAAAPREDRHVP